MFDRLEKSIYSAVRGHPSAIRALDLLIGKKQKEMLDLPVIEQNVARALVLRINDPTTQTFATLIPTIETLTSADKSMRLPHPTSLSTTSSFWLLKGDGSPISGSLMPYGGREGATRNGKPETPEECVVRELGEEALFYGIPPDKVQPILKRQHSFSHDAWTQSDGSKGPAQLTNNETILEVEVSSTQRAYSFDPKDHARRAVALTSQQTEELLTNDSVVISEVGPTPIPLVDSLSHKSEEEKASIGVYTDGQESRVRDEMIIRSYIFDTQVLFEFTKKMFESTGDGKRLKVLLSLLSPQSTEGRGPGAHVINDLDLKKAFSSYSLDQLKKLNSAITGLILNSEGYLEPEMDDGKVVQVLGQEVYTSLTNTQYSRGFETAIRKRVRLIVELKSAAQRVAFEHNLAYIKRAGPQGSFLLLQNLLQLDTLTTEDYKFIEADNDVRAIFGSVMSIFGIDSSNPRWFNSLKRSLQLYKHAKSEANSPNPTNPQINETLRIRASIRSEFARKYKIDPDELDDHIKSVWNWTRKYIDNVLRQINDPVLRGMLNASENSQQFLDLDELILRFMGIGVTTKEEQWVAARTIILALRHTSAERLWYENNHQPPRDPYGNIFFEKIVWKKIGDESFHGNNTFARWSLLLDQRIDTSVDIQKLGNQQIDLDTIDVQVLTHWRRKDLESVLRKLIERGEPEKGDIDDFFGRMIIIDSEKLWVDLVRKYPVLKSNEGKNGIIKELVRKITVTILHRYENEFPDQDKYTRTKVRDEGPVLGGLFEHPTYPGSGASKIKWSWLKFVHKTTIDDIEYQEELQIYPSQTDAALKLDDSERFNFDRLFDVHFDGYYPLALVLYLLQDAYPELMSRRYTRGVLYPGYQYTSPILPGT